MPNTRHHLSSGLLAACAALFLTSAPSANTEEARGPAAEPSGRADESSARAAEPSGRAAEPSGRAAEPNGRADGPSGAPPLDSIEQRAQPCMACHGKEGRATPEGYYPRIAGKPAGYLFNQLDNFRLGRRHFAMMTYMVDRQNDAFLHELADYFGNLHLPYANRNNSGMAPTLLERGRALVVNGDEALRIPACQSCHSKSLLGTLPAVPGLLGLSPDYVIGQLGAWRNGTRRAHEPDCMAAIARDLRSEDLEAVAWWLAGQQVPEDATPAADFETKPTVECGSFRTAGGTH